LLPTRRERSRTKGRYDDLEVTTISEIPLRQPVRVMGTVRSLTTVSKATSPTLEAMVADDSGRIVAVFLGRRGLGGLRCGESVVLEGVAQMHRGRLVMLNPLYTLRG
jgi:hypothetical protein